MSLKNIEAVLHWVSRGDAPEELAAAIGEVGALKEACRTLAKEGVEDFVYKVRDRAASDASFTGNTWEHPRVTAYGEAAQVIVNIAEESDT